MFHFSNNPKCLVHCVRSVALILLLVFGSKCNLARAQDTDFYVEPDGKVSWVSMTDILAHSKALYGKIVSVPGFCIRLSPGDDGYFLFPSKDSAEHIFARDAVALKYASNTNGYHLQSKSDYVKWSNIRNRHYCEVLGLYTSDSVKIKGMIPSRGKILVFELRGGSELPPGNAELPSKH